MKMEACGIVKITKMLNVDVYMLYIKVKYSSVNVQMWICKCQYTNENGSRRSFVSRLPSTARVGIMINTNEYK